MHPATLALLRAPDAPNGSPLSLTEIRTERRGAIVTGTACAADGGCYPIADGILDLLPEHLAVSPAQRSNFVWPTTAFYEQVWRVRSLSLLAGEPFSVNREIGIINRWLRPERGGVFVDVGTSHGLYARNIANRLRQSAASPPIIKCRKPPELPVAIPIGMNPNVGIGPHQLARMARPRLSACGVYPNRQGLD